MHLGRSIRPVVFASVPIVVVGCIYLATLSRIDKQGFWIADNANKFIQLRAILASGYTDWSIPWPGSRIDPAFECNPLPYAFSEVRDGRLYSAFSPVFATLSSLPYRLLGMSGLYVLPLLGSLFVLVGVRRIVQLLEAASTSRATGGASCAIAVLLTGLGTPLWFYTVTFWEHTLAACLCVSAVVFALRYVHEGSFRSLASSSALAAFGVYFRDELYLFCAALLIVNWMHTRNPALGTLQSRSWRATLLALLVMLVCLLPLWVFQWLSIGEPLGLHIQRNLMAAPGVAAHWAARGRVFYNLLVASGPELWRSFVVSAPYLILLAVRPALPSGTFAHAVPLACLVTTLGSLATLLGYLGAESPILWMDSSNSLFNTCPLLVLAFLRRREASQSPEVHAEKWLWYLCVVFAGLYILAAPELSSKGLHWGNRYLLVLYPLCSALAGTHLASWWRTQERKGRWSIPLVALALVTSLAMQLYSLDLLRRKTAFTHRFNQAVQARPEPAVTTDVPWVGHEVFSVFYEKPVFYVPSWERLERLLAKLAANGYDNVLFVSQSAGEQAEAVAVDDGGLNYFSVQLFSLEHGVGAPTERD